MSIMRCEYCDVDIDTDYNAEHFNTLNDKYECVEEEIDNELPNWKEEINKI